MPSNFLYQLFVALCRSLGGKVPVVYIVLFLKQGIFPSNSMDEKFIEFEFQTDWTYYVDLRLTYLALKLKLSNGRDYETYKTKEVGKTAKWRNKRVCKRWQNRSGKARVSSASKNSWKHDFALNVLEWWSVHQYSAKSNSNGLFALKSYISNNFERTNFEHNWFLHCVCYDYEECTVEIRDPPLSELSFTRKC